MSFVFSLSSRSINQCYEASHISKTKVKSIYNVFIHSKNLYIVDQPAMQLYLFQLNYHQPTTYTYRANTLTKATVVSPPLPQHYMSHLIYSATHTIHIHPCYNKTSNVPHLSTLPVCMPFRTDDFGFPLNVLTSTLTYPGSINNGHWDYMLQPMQPVHIFIVFYGVFSFLAQVNCGPISLLDFASFNSFSIIYAIFMLLTYYTSIIQKKNIIFLFST